ncbi:hypothetical protein GDO78_004077 [Eleutherodactylus coqui]|uniref:Leucine rich repeat containing 45 n=1 Tax=Eleutherodactylus coqui TaxID=57060 RepID=A0A8J6EPW3_ELECQ|nr:hypothetical protein GDO78_004077 [Eleutherodactylus coqui]
MDELKRLYIKLCQEKGSDPQEAVLKELQRGKESSGKGRLDLSTHNLSVESCQVLGLLLQNDVTSSHVALSDCMLSEAGTCCGATVVRSCTLSHNLEIMDGPFVFTGLKHILQGLRNNAVVNLTLEWNNLGMWEDGFSLLCDGLGCNQTLQRLDLRNNQINHKGAEELSTALKQNLTLRELDLRWNNIGLLGGRALLDCLQSNKAIMKMELSGNNIPSDILKAIEQAIDHNLDRQTVKMETASRRQILTKEVQNLKQEKNKQFLDLMGTIDKQREEMSRTTRLHMTDAALALSQQKVQDLGAILTQTKRDGSNMRELHVKELMKEKEESGMREAKLRQELGAANEKVLLYRSKADELEKRCKMQQEQLFDLKQELTNTSADLKLRAVQAEGKDRPISWLGLDEMRIFISCICPHGDLFSERLESEKRRFRQSQDEASVLRQKEVEHMTRHMEDNEKVMQERMQRLEATKLGLEEVR